MRSSLRIHVSAWFLSVSSLAACLVAGTPATATLLPERVEKAAQEYIVTGTCQTLVFGMVDGDRSEIVAFGKLDDGAAPDGDTVYEIGSITKTFTATLLARAVISGRVTLDTPLTQLLPDFKIPARGGKEITLGALATQRSGLPRLPSNMKPKEPADPYADFDAAKLKAFLAGYELRRDPGASYEYSNLGFGLLGHALAEMDHTAYGALAADAIFKPLGMTMTGTALTEAMRVHLAPGHDEAGKAAKNWNFDALAGAGAIRSTASDMLQYLRANMGFAPSPLSDAMKLAQQPRSDMPKSMRVGLAWMTAAKGIVWHNGGTGGYASFAGFAADGRRGVVILTNTAVSVDGLGFATLDADAPLAPVHKAITLPAASLEDYEGIYKLADNFMLKVIRTNDGLFGQATGQQPIALFASAPNEFFSKAAGISITFTRDDKGAVNGLVLHQNGDHAAPKLSTSEPKAVTLDAAALGDYAGRYRFDFGAVYNITLQGDHLEAQMAGQPALPIHASARDRFFYKIVDAQLTFERDSDGKVVAVVLHQNGRDMRAPRVGGER